MDINSYSYAPHMLDEEKMIFNVAVCADMIGTDDCTGDCHECPARIKEGKK